MIKLSRWSLSTRLIVWYVVSSTVLLLALFEFLTWSILSTLDFEDDELLENDLRRVENVLKSRAGDPDQGFSRLDSLWAEREFEPVHLRILGRDGVLVYQSPNFPKHLAKDDFPKEFLGAERFTTGITAEPQDENFRLKAGRLPFSASSGGEQLLMQIALDRTHESSIFSNHNRTILILASLSVVLSLALGNLIVRSSLRPLTAVIAELRKVGASNLGKRISADGLPPELAVVPQTFNETLARLERSFASISQFSNNIAHELRTPLNVIRGGVEVALTKPRTSEEYREVLSTTLEETVRVSEIIESLLFLARSDGRPGEVEREPVEVATALEDLGEYYEPMAAEAGISLRLKSAPGIVLSVNRSLFRQAIGNLVRNAIVHAGAGAVVDVGVEREASGVVVSVADNGVGIAAKDLPQLFDRFYTGDSARSSSGVGLGLAITRAIVELHGGTVSVQSEPGRGTKVYLRFPQGRALV